MISLTLFVALSTLAAAPTPTVGVVSYQALSVEPVEVERVEAALQAELKRRGFAQAAPLNQRRAAAMCGEDAECLATLGQRAKATLLIALGLGRIGDFVVVTARLIDTEQGKALAAFNEKVPSLEGDLAALSSRVLEVLLRAAPTPKVESPPLLPTAPIVIAQPTHRLRPWAVGSAITAGVLAGGGAALTFAASAQFERLRGLDATMRVSADQGQRTLNVAADVTVGLAITTAAVAVLLFIFDAREGVNP